MHPGTYVAEQGEVCKGENSVMCHGVIVMEPCLNGLSLSEVEVASCVMDSLLLAYCYRHLINAPFSIYILSNANVELCLFCYH